MPHPSDSSLRNPQSVRIRQRRTAFALSLCATAVFSSACGSSSSESSEANSPDRVVQQDLSTLIAPDPMAEAPENTPDVVARASFLPLSPVIHPGKPFYLAMQFQLADGYRLSWTNPGEVGGKTKVKFRGPEGFEISEALFPVPTKFQVGGKYEAYGYEKEVVIFARVMPPGRLSNQDTFRFDVKAHWLACKKECVSEDAQAYFELTANASVLQETDPDLAEWLDRLPKSFADRKGAYAKWTRSKLNFALQGVFWSEFFYANHDGPKILDQGPRGGTYQVNFETPQSHPANVEGVLIGKEDGKDVAFYVDVEWK